MEIIRQMAL